MAKIMGRRSPGPNPKRRAKTAAQNREGKAAEAETAEGRTATATVHTGEAKRIGGSAAAAAAAAEADDGGGERRRYL